MYAELINKMAGEVRHDNEHWWRHPRTGKPLKPNKGQQLMLMVSEISEAMEGERKGLMDDHLPHRKAAEVELADLLIRLLDYAGGWGLDLGGAYMEKREYNRTRADHSNAARLKKGGKKW